jgi:putative hydrolase
VQLIADLHTHTIASGHAYSTLQENLDAARENGLRYLATTEHGPSMPGSCHAIYFANFRALPDQIAGVRLVKGIEANILNTAGELDLPEKYLKRLEYIAVGLHRDCMPPGSVEENTQAVLNALQNPYVDTLVHPGNPRFPIDCRRVVQAATDLGVMIEINNSSLLGSRKGSNPICAEIARLAASSGCTVVLGSDAHWSGHVGRLDLALQLALEAGVPEAAIINLHAERMEALLQRNAHRRQGGPRIPIR